MAASSASGSGSMRPRANTISHIDNASLGLLSSENAFASHIDSSGLSMNHSSVHGLPGVNGYHFRGMSTASGHHGTPHVLPKLETKHRNVDLGMSLRTAPAYGHFGHNMEAGQPWNQPGSTINPAQLHFAASPQSFNFDSPQSPFSSSFQSLVPTNGTMDGDGTFSWLNSFDHQMSFNEHAIENSSPSDSGGSPDGSNEMMLDSSMNRPSSADMWPNTTISPTQHHPNSTFGMDLSAPQYSELYNIGQLSPKSMGAQFGADQFYPTPPPLSSQVPIAGLQGMGSQLFQPLAGPKSETPSNSAASISSSNRQSSVTSHSTDSITEVTRNALLTSLSQHSLYGYNNFKTSQPHIPSPLSPCASGRGANSTNVPLPSTFDLQRYVGAYIQYFHPHLPFLHIPSLSFDSPAFTTGVRASGHHFEYGSSNATGGGGALILAMAAIGALYEYDFGPSKDLFDMSRTMIRLYTGERRKADVSSSFGGNSSVSDESASNTPLWLVQAMLLNVIYGHNCGDKIAAGIASTLCGTVINLARSAKLVSPVTHNSTASKRMNHGDIEMAGNEIRGSPWDDHSPFGTGDLQTEWLQWKQAEERKRTLFAIFILSSLLVSAYNHPPALMNSEIRIDLPCDEGLWAADSAQTWKSMGGSSFQQNVPFASALTSLLTAHQREQKTNPSIPPLFDNGNLSLENLPPVDFKPSTFGCLVLINALHNYIWETRQRHTSLEWTAQETEAMHARIEPALRTWQAAWSLNPEHSMGRPNPFGANSLSADCIPLLDLAYLRLFVNLGRSKEAFFQRDWDAMADELANGQEIIQHANHSASSTPTLGIKMEEPGPNGLHSSSRLEGISEEIVAPLTIHDPSSSVPSSYCSIRERHLRKAAFYAANSLTLSDRLGVTFADFNSRELPLQSALCAFDCAQVLAEWVSTVQQRVGPHLGTLGREPVDPSQLKSTVFLEKDDCELMEKIDQILKSITTKLEATGINKAAMEDPGMDESGYGSKILLVHARMFERASIWPSRFFPVALPFSRAY